MNYHAHYWTHLRDRHSPTQDFQWPIRFCYFPLFTVTVQIFDNGRLDHYIDGSDENAASWMRFIRCARFKEEQNLFAFQYGGNVYYRAFRDIPMGEELLVWYDDKYPQHMGIPVGLQDMPFVPRSGKQLWQGSKSLPLVTTLRSTVSYKSRPITLVFDLHFQSRKKALSSYGALSKLIKLTDTIVSQ